MARMVEPRARVLRHHACSWRCSWSGSRSARGSGCREARALLGAALRAVGARAALRHVAPRRAAAARGVVLAGARRPRAEGRPRRTALARPQLRAVEWA